MIIGGLASLIGICIILYAVKLFVTKTWSLMLGGDSGASSVFVVGKVGNLLPTIICILGIIILLCGIFTLVRSNNNDK